MAERSLAEIDWQALLARRFHPSPAAWEDQVLYFLMLDRFSDGREDGVRDLAGAELRGTTPLFALTDAGNADPAAWQAAGGRWCGGTLAGLRSKLGYLSRLGVTALWISPVFKQVAFGDSYHGYGIQHFLDVDGHFGHREELRELVREAHEAGIYVVLDIILNHAGHVFTYRPDRYWTERDGHGFFEPRWDGRPYEVAGYTDEHGEPTLPFAPLAERDPGRADRGIWPVEFQVPQTFSRLGQITNWDYEPEFLTGDFFDLKDIDLGGGQLDDFVPSPALRALAQVYKFWMAYADVDGYRIDTVKHMGPGATRYFASEMHEFAQRLGKENFYLVGEITGGRVLAFQTLEETGLNAALGVDEIPDKLEYLVKGYRNPADYFALFRNSLLVQKESHVWFRDKVVTMFDDHDQVRRGRDKARFCAREEGWRVVSNALALNVCTMGIPCVYYGSEQYFNGAGDSDRYLRECMFGGAFGSCRSAGRHFFTEASPAYRELAAVLAVRRRLLPLRRGRQYLRETSGDGTHFGLPEMLGGQIRAVVPWSRIFSDEEVVCAINTDYDRPSTDWVTVDARLHPPGSTLVCQHSTDRAQIGESLTVEPRNGSAVHLTVPAAGFVVYA
jgi:glycosidase